MYVATQDVGDFKEGDQVPDMQAELWMDMYVHPPVKKVDKIEEKLSVPEEEDSDSESSKPSLLEDYLGRNGNTVAKNIQEDELSKEQLEEMLKLEKEGKNRAIVVDAVMSRLEGEEDGGQSD